MSRFEPFFHGLSVETGAIGSFAPPLRGEESFGSMPTAKMPGNGLRSSVTPGLNSAERFFRSKLKNLTKPSGKSDWSAPTVGKSLPGRLKLTPKAFGVIFKIRI